MAKRIVNVSAQSSTAPPDEIHGPIQTTAPPEMHGAIQNTDPPESHGHNYQADVGMQCTSVTGPTIQAVAGLRSLGSKLANNIGGNITDISHLQKKKKQDDSWGGKDCQSNQMRYVIDNLKMVILLILV
ncbi:hypothetical protein O6H91_02G087600 [Diphasiastrum complanatum]|uniref:Uncharacterized protein n=1 Tax=Diphasiastrum complanatum TaxID=34168 RepID=A0ACC2EI47_DIPCM|nr:hypothetical protein O6H91_02G087600 [Diphasiastrum complanatum]